MNEFNKTGKIPEGAPPVEYSVTREWVCTDPVANIPIGDDASDYIFPYPETLTISAFDEDNEIFIQDISVIISERAPTVGLDGNAPKIGDLWWSNLNGKMYILFNSPNGNVWVVTNPSSALGLSFYAINDIPWEGGGSLIPPGGEVPETPEGIEVVPELADQEILWVLDYEMFVTNDQYEIVTNADPESNELLLLKEKLLYDPSNSELNTRRGVNQIANEIPNLTVIKNVNTSIYEVWTDVDHHMLKGDLVTISGSSIERVNGEHPIAKTGTIRLAKLRARTNASGIISQVFIDDPGFGYESGFYVEVIGNGVGAQLFAQVQTFEMGGTGQVVDVVIQSGGVGFTEYPVLVATPAAGQYARNYFAVFIDSPKEDERNPITYTTKSATVESDIHKIDVKSNGSGYFELPPVDGIIKKEINRAAGLPLLTGTTISGVKMTNIGSRYHNPTPVFSDLAGNGRGAEGTCVLLDDLIVDVQITNTGIGYTEPVVEFVEMDDIVYCDSQDIGVITSINVLSPGRNIPSDLSTRPEIEIETRLLIEYDERYGRFDPGDDIFQGTALNKQSEATVISYDEFNHTLLIDDIKGIFVKGNDVRTVSGKRAKVVNVKQSRTNIEVSGVALQEGRFITEKSFVSSVFSVIQDSYYYQNFSYLISSQIESDRYINFVNSIVHPAGFGLFTDIRITDSVSTVINIEDIDLEGDVQIIDVAGNDGGVPDQVIGTDNGLPIKTVISWDDK